MSVTFYWRFLTGVACYEILFITYLWSVSIPGVLDNCVSWYLLKEWWKVCFDIYYYHHICLCPTFNTLRPRQNARHFPDDTSKRNFVNEATRISTKISLSGSFLSLSKGPINNIPVLAEIMAWHRPGGKPISEPMVVSLLTHICVTRPRWVNIGNKKDNNYKKFHDFCDTPLWMLTRVNMFCK